MIGHYLWLANKMNESFSFNEWFQASKILRERAVIGWFSLLFLQKRQDWFWLSHLAISYHKTKSLAGKAWIFPIFSSSIQMVLYNSRNYSMLILAMFLLIIIKKEPNEDCISSLKCKSNWRMIVWVLFRLAAQALGFPFLSPYLQSIGSDYRHGANYATLASTVLLPNTSLFVTGISPFSLAIQLNQMKEFKVKVDEFHATNQTGDVTNI